MAWSADARCRSQGRPARRCGSGSFALTALQLHELDPVIGQHGVDLVRYGSDQRLEEAGGGEFGGAAADAGEDQFGSAIDRDVEERLAPFVAQFGNVDVKVANLVILELLRLLPVGLGQAADAMALQTAMEGQARQVRGRVFERDVNVIHVRRQNIWH